MEYVLLLTFLWFGASIAVLAVLHGAALRAVWREPVLGCPVLIIESDDWGPGPPEDAAALRTLARTLMAIRDGGGQPAVMTLGVVGGVADGAAILASGCTRYVRRTLAESDFAPIVEAMCAGCRSGVFALQRHGLEHFWPASLLARAKWDAALQGWLADSSARSETLPPVMQSRWIDCAVLPSTPLPRAEIETAVNEEVVLLRQIFGEVPTVAVPNTFVWSDAVERAWVASGVDCIVTPGRQVEGRDAAGVLLPATRIIRNGSRGEAGAMYVVRDDYFEPVRGHRAEHVWQAVAAKEWLGRPALLETHRENFVASPAAAAHSLAELERALCGVLERHPAVRFMTTTELARSLGDPKSPLLVNACGLRLKIFWRRVLCDATLGRTLKWTGLRVAIRLAQRIAHCVMCVRKTEGIGVVRS